jgi:polysaccharide export outer membrane protein
MKKKLQSQLSYFSLVFVTVFCITSCNSYKKVPYLQTKEKGNEIDLFTLAKKSTVRFQPDDVLAITFNVVEEQSVAVDYNLPLQPAPTNPGDMFMNEGIGRQTFMVNKNGQIDIPSLGLTKVAGYTQAELEGHLKAILKTQLKTDPVVTVRLVNFRINVLGEVNRPGLQSISDKDHLNILEALSLAGDMTLYGSRDDVRILREMPNGDLKMVRLDISKTDIVASPYFYLQQNDIVYVVPNKVRSQIADISPQLSTVVSVGSFAISLVSFALLISRW